MLDIPQLQPGGERNIPLQLTAQADIAGGHFFHLGNRHAMAKFLGGEIAAWDYDYTL